MKDPRLLAQLSRVYWCEHWAARDAVLDGTVPIEVGRLGAIAVELETRARAAGWRGDPHDAFDPLCHSPGRDYATTQDSTGSDHPRTR